MNLGSTKLSCFSKMGSFMVDPQDGTNESVRAVSLNALVDAGNGSGRYQKQTDFRFIVLALVRSFLQSVCLLI